MKSLLCAFKIADFNIYGLAFSGGHVRIRDGIYRQLRAIDSQCKHARCGDVVGI